MTVKIDRYQLKIKQSNPVRYYIRDMKYAENFLWIESNNKKLSEKLSKLCLEYLNTGELSND